LPFEGSNLATLAIKITSGEFKPLPLVYSLEMHGLIKRLLSLEQRSRPEVIEILEMPIIMRSFKKYLSETVVKSDLAVSILL